MYKIIYDSVYLHNVSLQKQILFIYLFVYFLPQSYLTNQKFVWVCNLKTNRLVKQVPISELKITLKLRLYKQVESRAWQLRR